MSNLLMDLPDNWKETVLDLYKEGAADVEVRAALGLTYRAWTELMLDSDEFNALVSKGRQLSEAFWYMKGRLNLENPKFQQSLWYRNMQNRFGWRDKSDSTSSATTEEDDMISVEDVDKEITRVAGNSIN